MAVEFVLKF